jgi:hypothetical protein
MAEGRFVAYYRVSTAKQGASGLGLEAQRAAVADYLNGGNWMLMTEHAEVESGSIATARPSPRPCRTASSWARRWSSPSSTG